MCSEFSLMQRTISGLLCPRAALLQLLHQLKCGLFFFFSFATCHLSACCCCCQGHHAPLFSPNHFLPHGLLPPNLLYITDQSKPSLPPPLSWLMAECLGSSSFFPISPCLLLGSWKFRVVSSPRYVGQKPLHWVLLTSQILQCYSGLGSDFPTPFSWREINRN